MDYMFEDDSDEFHGDFDDDESDDSDEFPVVPLDARIVLVNNNDPSITDIGFEGGETRDRVVAVFQGLHQNTHVRELDLYDAPGDICQRLLPPLLLENSTVRYINFPRGMTNAQLLPSAEILWENLNATVKGLDMTGCDIRGREGGEMIARMMENNRNLTMIDLCRNTNLGPAAATRIAGALGRADCSLKTLNLDRCSIGEEGMAAVFAALRINVRLKDLIIGQDNTITEGGYRSLAGSFPHMTGLTTIRFDWSPRVSPTGLQELMGGLRNNRSLQHILTDHNRLPGEQRELWKTCSKFVCARNKINGRLEEVRNRTCAASREGKAPPALDALLPWCRRQGDDEEVEASLIYCLVSLRSNEIVRLANGKRARRRRNGP